MPIVCIERPNRTEPRPFNERDLQRIAKLVQKSGVSVFKILGVVAFAIGLGAIICKAARLIDSFTGVLRILREIAIVLATSLAIKTMITFLQRSPIIRIPILNRVVIVVIILLVLIDRLMQRFSGLAKTLVDLEPITDTINNVCSAIIETAKDAIDKGEDVTQDLIDLF